MTSCVSDYGESGILSFIKKTVGIDSNLLLGIGDDAAAVNATFQHPMVMASDAMVEDTHFQRDWSAGECTGRKLVAVNCSDMAAMGARPHYAMLTVGFPASLEWNWVEGFFRGLAQCSQALGVSLVGGDTVRTTGPIFLNLAVVGECVSHKPLCRSGALPGDRIYVTGPLGLAAYGLHTALHQRASMSNRPLSVAALQLGKARLDEGIALATWGQCHAAMDLSDGLAQDLSRIAESSDVHLRINIESIPLGEEAVSVDRLMARKLAIHGGEDYELLFTANQPPPFPCHCIGKVLPGPPAVSWETDSEILDTPPGGVESFSHYSDGSN